VLTAFLAAPAVADVETVGAAAVPVANSSPRGSSIPLDTCQYTAPPPCEALLAADYGAAVYIDQFCSDVSLTRSTFEKNVATQQGGGIHSKGDDLLLDNCQIRDNQAATGGGMHASTVEFVSITSTDFTGNAASGNYGALYVKSTVSVTIALSNFTGNRAINGGAIGVTEGQNTLVKEYFFADNSASVSGGGLMVSAGDSLSITSCQFESNSNYQGSGSVVWISANAAASIQSSRFARAAGHCTISDLNANMLCSKMQAATICALISTE
jgi:predicted outer membrane repeat protein